MSKKKSVFVTAIMSIMLAAIAFAAYRLTMPVFIAVVSLLSVAGFVSLAISFCKWLQKPSGRSEDGLDIINFKARPYYEKAPSGDFSMTYEQIKQELNSEGK